MKVWISVYVTVYDELPQFNRAHFFYDDDALGLHLNHILSYKEGMKALRQAEKLLGRSAEMKVNYYGKGICYKEIYGFITRE